MSGGWHPRTTGWALRRLHVAKLRLAWAIVRELRVNRYFGVPDKPLASAPPPTK